MPAYADFDSDLADRLKRGANRVNVRLTATMLRETWTVAKHENACAILPWRIKRELSGVVIGEIGCDSRVVAEAIVAMHTQAAGLRPPFNQVTT